MPAGMCWAPLGMEMPWEEGLETLRELLFPSWD